MGPLLRPGWPPPPWPLDPSSSRGLVACIRLIRVIAATAPATHGLREQTPAARVGGEGRNFRVCALLHQEVDRPTAIRSCGKHECRLSVCGILGVYLGSMREQHLERVDAAGTRRDHQRGRAGSVDGVSVRPGLQQGLHQGRASILRGDEQRSDGAQTSLSARARSGVEQQLCHREIIIRRSPMQRGHAVRLRTIHIRLLLKLAADCGEVSRLRRIRERGPRAGGRKEPRNRQQASAQDCARHPNIPRSHQKEISPVLSPTRSTGTPSLCKTLSHTFPSGVSSGAMTLRFPLSVPLACPASSSGTRL